MSTDNEHKLRLFDNEYEDDFLETVNSNYQPLTTGITDLDKILGGGFYPDLYVLAAPTGNGKTTLALQITAHLAQNEQPVLYIALEMSRKELQAKQIGSLMFDLLGMDEYEQPEGGVPQPQHLLYGACKEDKLFQDAVSKYFSEVGPNVCVEESVGNTSIESIGNMAELVTEKKGKAPFIVVDYLQVLPAAEIHMTERQAVDNNVLELKRLSRKLNCTVLVLSSMSRKAVDDIREKYNNGQGPIVIPEGCCKESGTIEYTAGMLLGMYILNYDVYIAVLKNRFGNRTEWNKPEQLSFNGQVSKFGNKGEFTP